MDHTGHWGSSLFASPQTSTPNHMPICELSQQPCENNILSKVPFQSLEQKIAQSRLREILEASKSNHVRSLFEYILKTTF